MPDENPRVEALRVAANKMLAEHTILTRMFGELLGTFARSRPDPAGYITRMLDRAEVDVRDGYNTAYTSEALDFALKYIEQFRRDLAPIVERDPGARP